MEKYLIGEGYFQEIFKIQEATTHPFTICDRKIELCQTVRSFKRVGKFLMLTICDLVKLIYLAILFYLITNLDSFCRFGK